jgi:putative DNA primase/helicase
MTQQTFTVPKQLQNWQFILLAPKTKIPIGEMRGWADNREQITLTSNSQKLAEHMQKGGNYGAVTDKDCFVVASDTKEVEQAIEQRLPKTFTVQSPRHKTKHFYFYGYLTHFIQCKPTAQGDPCADIKFGNAYVLGPQSVFMEYGTYQIIDDLPIATITEEQLLAAIDEFIERKKSLETSNNQAIGNPELNFPITNIIPNIDAFMQTDYDLSGPHPIHGSTTGSNFHINTEKNVWYCFRHHTGGGPLDLLAVLNNIIKCEEAGKGSLRDEKFKQTIDKAKELGVISKNVFLPQTNDTKSKEAKEQQIAEILTQLKALYTFKTPTDLKDLYYYENGIYKPAESKIENLLEQQLDAKAYTYLINEIINHLQRASYVDRDEFNKYTGLIPVENGLLNLQTMQLEPFSKDKIFTYKLNVTYNPETQCPTWNQFLNQILPSEDQALLQEWLGYCILPAMPKHKIMWLYGTGRNGKGRVIATIEYIIGKQNCCYLELKEFDGEHRFATAQLYSKLINVSSEPSTIKDLQTPLLKKITGEDTLDAEVKNKQKRLSFKNIAKPFVMGNVFPKVKDQSVGFWDRVKIIKFPNEFIGKNQKDNIEETWLKNPHEVSGIFNWMLIGLHRLLAQGDFTDSKNTQETITEFKRASDSIGAWIDTNCIFDVDAFITRKEAYENYKTYADDLDTSPESDTKFYAELRSKPKIKDHKTKVDRGFKGIKLKTPEPKEEPKEKGQQTLTTQQKVADAAKSAPSCNSLNKTTDSISFINSQTHAELAESATTNKEIQNNRVCGDCGRFHLSSCGFPNGAFEKVPADWWAGEMRCWIAKQPDLPEYREEPPECM